MSQPARNAACARCVMPPAAAAPSMVKSSEKITPSNLSQPRRMSCSQTGEKPAGRLSICPYTTWAGITAAMPAADRAANGRRSSACNSSKLRESCGRVRWLSPPTKPWPGKCLPQDFMPPRFRPRCNANANSITTSASLWKLRLPITAQFPQSKSNTGVNDKSMPQAASSAASTQPTVSARSLAASAPCPSHISPNTRMAGRRVKPVINRCTRPPS